METDDELPVSGEQTQKIVAVIAGIVVFLTIAVFAAYGMAKKRQGEIILPGGITYTGEKKTEATPTPAPTTVPSQSGVYTAPANDTWQTWHGTRFPFAFQYPKSLPLVAFPTDPADAVGVGWNNARPEQNLLMNVTDITSQDILKQYVGKPTDLVTNWYRQFGGLAGVKSVEMFTNSRKTTGYRAVYLTHTDGMYSYATFFIPPSRPKLLVWMGKGVLDQSVFDKIVDTFEWKEPATTAK